MAKVRFIRDTEESILGASPADGTIYVSTDTNNIYIGTADGFERLTKGYTISKSGNTITLTDSEGNQTSVTDANTTYNNATSSAAGLMSASDKTKLDNLDSTISAAIGEEASARQKQDQLLEQAIEDKLGADDIVAGSNVQVNHDEASGHVTISATDTTYTAGAGLTLSGTEFGIADGGIIGRYLDDNCVMERNIVVGSVTSDKIPALAITTPKLADNAVTAIKMADDAVATRSIQNRAVTADKLAAGVIPEDTNTTYTLTKSGSTITLEGSDGSSTSVTDANTTYTLSSFGITATAAEINYLDGVTFAIQAQLDSKAPIEHTHSYLPLSGGTLTGTVTSRSLAAATDSTYDIGTNTVRYRNIYADNLYGTVQNPVATADKLTNARNISLTGDVTGTTSFNGSTNVSIVTSLAANSVTANEIAAGAVGSSELTSNAVTLAKLGSDVGTVAVQSSEPTDTNVKLWIQI